MADLTRMSLVRVVCIQILFATGLWLASTDPYLDFSGDSATYLILARSLAERGTYDLISHPQEVRERRYPPVYPIFIAGINRLTGWYAIDEGPLIRTLKLSSFAFILCALFFHLLSEKSTGAGTWMLGTLSLLWVIHPLIRDYANLVRTEAPFLATSFAVIWAYGKSVRTQGEISWPTSHLLRLSILLALLCGIRSIGFVLLGSVILHLLLVRRYREAWIIATLTGIMLAPWQMRNLMIDSDRLTYWQYLLIDDPVSGSKITSISALIAKLATRALSVASIVGGLSWGMYLPEETYTSLFPLIPLSGAALIGIGYFHSGAKRLAVGHIYVPAYIAILVVWPYHMQRLYLPILPFLFVYTLVGGSWILHRIRDRVATLAHLNRAIILLATLVVVLTFLPHHIEGIERARTPIDERTLEDGIKGFLKSLRWIRTNAPPGSVVYATSPQVVYAYTGHPSLDFLRLPPHEAVTVLKKNRVTTVIEDRITWTDRTTRYLLPTLQYLRADQRIELVYSSDETTPTRVWRVDW